MRKNTGVTLTPAGQLLLSRSESITREMKNMVNEISGMSSEAVVEVSFGFPSLIGFTFMSGMINKFKEVFPKAQVSMYEAQLSSFLPAIRDGRLDFAIGTLSAEMKLQDLHVEPLFESEFVLVASKSRTCTGTTTLESLKNEQWVLPQTNMGYYSELLTTLQRNGISIENIVKSEAKAQETVSEAAEDESTTGKKKYDVGKIMALKKAGWKVKDIADEMKMTAQQVSNQIYLYNKKMQENGAETEVHMSRIEPTKRPKL